MKELFTPESSDNVATHVISVTVDEDVSTHVSSVTVVVC